jgi:hypothetical protein
MKEQVGGRLAEIIKEAEDRQVVREARLIDIMIVRKELAKAQLDSVGVKMGLASLTTWRARPPSHFGKYSDLPRFGLLHSLLHPLIIASTYPLLLSIFLIHAIMWVSEFTTFIVSK